MIKPEKPISGKPIPRGWFAMLFDWICSLEVYGDGKTIFTKKTSRGICLSAKPFENEKGANPSTGGGSQIAWAKITAVTDANNYTASIWTDRNETDPTETLKAVYVSDIVDVLAINDWIPVQTSNRTYINYENIQQLGLL